MRIFLSIFLIVVCCMNAAAQSDKQLVRIAKIEVDPAQLSAYINALKEQMNTAIALEKGVLTYYAVAEKSVPQQITILEIYADSAAYLAHIKTAHFLKYKETVKDMVKALTLVDVNLIGVARQPD